MVVCVKAIVDTIHLYFQTRGNYLVKQYKLNAKTWLRNFFHKNMSEIELVPLSRRSWSPKTVEVASFVIFVVVLVMAAISISYGW